MAAPAETSAMRRAIALSALGLGTTSPNPQVGCVILDPDGQVVGEGFHRRKGESHAEALALDAAGDRAHGGTAVVTLEPCNHHGLTPPCTQALVDAGIVRVVVALIDPTSRGDGGVAVLRRAGVEVESKVLGDEARGVVGPWLDALSMGRPHVRLLGYDRERIDSLRKTVDAVLWKDGHIEEGIPGGHGKDFNLPDISTMTTTDVLDALYQAGVRSLLVVDPSPAAPHLPNRAH